MQHPSQRPPSTSNSTEDTAQPMPQADPSTSGKISAAHKQVEPDMPGPPYTTSDARPVYCSPESTSSPPDSLRAQTGHSKCTAPYRRPEQADKQQSSP